MEAPVPQNMTEEQFFAAAKIMLPEIDLEIGRNEWGTLYYRWLSPSPMLGALSVYVKDGEVQLSTKISHAHVDGHDFGGENLADEEISQRIVQTGVAKAAAIMRSEIAFTETFDGHGNKFSSGVCETRHLAESLRYTRQVFGQEMTERAYIWQGEIAIQD